LSIAEVAALFVQRIRSEQHQEALKNGLAALAKRFGDDKHGEGYEKVGSVAYTRFYGEDDEDEDDLVSRQRFAAGLVQSLLAEIVTCSPLIHTEYCWQCPMFAHCGPSETHRHLLCAGS